MPSEEHLVEIIHALARDSLDARALEDAEFPLLSRAINELAQAMEERGKIDDIDAAWVPDDPAQLTGRTEDQ